MENKIINDILNNLVKSYQQKYGIAVFDIEAKKSEKGYDLEGYVLTENQKDEVLNLLRQNGIDVISDKISVLSNFEKRNEIGWGVVKADIADLKKRFVSNKIINDRILKRIRCSQAFKGDILRIIFKNEDQFLVQQEDLTLGWINKNQMVLKRHNLLKDWKSDKIAIPDITIECNGSVGNVAKEAEKYLGVKYVLGGKSEKGIDCSALVQIAYKNSLGIILPKHSWDQKKIGKKVELKNARTGDLVFLIKKINKHKHVGIVSKEKKDIFLIHASLGKKRVLKEKLKDVFLTHDLVEARRVM